MNLLVALILSAGTLLFGLQTLPAAPPAPSVKMAAPAPETAPAVSAAGVKPAVTVHRVTAGESLSVIAARYAIDVDTLLGANPEAEELIHPGDELVILPQKGAVHAVAAGDTLWRLAQVYGVSVTAIRAANNKEGDALAVGEKLFIPGGRARSEQVSRGYGQRFVWPTAGTLTSGFGYRWGRLHAGIDLAADEGTPVRAAQAGRTVSAGWRSGYGYTVVLDHGHGYTTLYAHLADYEVEAGQYVRAGQLIGYVGDTGYSFGAHLHFEIRLHGQAVNPLQYLP